MKYLFFILNFFVFTAAVSAQDNIPAEWKVSVTHAQAMVNYYSSCTKCPSSTAVPDKEKEDSIRAAFPDAKSITWENARYTKDDIVRYAKRRGMSARSAVSQVTGYSTQLLRVVDANDEEHYFDIVNICPPPAGCN